MAPDYHFRPICADDLPMIACWLALPHVRAWWGDPAEQYALVSGDLEEPAMDQYIVELDGRAFAYLQCYDLTEWNSPFGAQPAGTRGIDLFIGEPTMLGHGSAFISRFVKEKLRQGVPRIVTDPDPTNGRDQGL
jgi:aminoglycoside 6'-N-acetyltransferase